MTTVQVPYNVPKLPPGIEMVPVAGRPHEELPVICGGCNQPFRPKELKPWKGRRLCKECLDLEERSRKTEAVLMVVKEIMTRKVDLSDRGGRPHEGALELNTARKGFLEEFGGETTFGMRWAQLLKHVCDRAMIENKNVTTAAKMFMDAAKFLEAAKEREASDFSTMTLEQMKEYRARILVEHMKDRVLGDAIQKVVSLAEVASMDGASMDEIIEQFDRLLGPRQEQEPALTLVQSA